MLMFTLSTVLKFEKIWLELYVYVIWSPYITLILVYDGCYINIQYNKFNLKQIAKN